MILPPDRLSHGRTRHPTAGPQSQERPIRRFGPRAPSIGKLLGVEPHGYLADLKGAGAKITALGGRLVTLFYYELGACQSSPRPLRSVPVSCSSATGTTAPMFTTEVTRGLGWNSPALAVAVILTMDRPSTVSQLGACQKASGHGSGNFGPTHATRFFLFCGCSAAPGRTCLGCGQHGLRTRADARSVQPTSEKANCRAGSADTVCLPQSRHGAAMTKYRMVVQRFDELATALFRQRVANPELARFIL